MIPVATALACSWNLKLIEQLGRLVGEEMEEFGGHLWLAPGMNIHRDPLCGRNFEYYSEDPLVAGVMAGSFVRGVQSQKVSACVKHFALNNKETNRKNSDSRVSERAAREIYLKAFQKPLEECDANGVMTAYTRWGTRWSGSYKPLNWMAPPCSMAEVEPDELDEKYKRWQFDTLPSLPEDIPLKVIYQSRDQYKVVKELINAADTDRLVCATDAGREGELIFRTVYYLAGCSKPMKRLWISSMTDEAIKEGFRKIQPGEKYDGLYRSAQCRYPAGRLAFLPTSQAAGAPPRARR